MNKNTYVSAIRLLGKLVQSHGIRPEDYRGIERELIEQAIRDNAFYASTDKHEAAVVEARAKRKPGRPAKSS